jgi:hypothetical protein
MTDEKPRFALGHVDALVGTVAAVLEMAKLDPAGREYPASAWFSALSALRS